MTPLILDQARFELRLPALRADRVSGQAILVGVLAVAFGAILLARPTGGAGSVASVPPAGAVPTIVAPSDGAPSTAGAGGTSSEPATPEPTPEATAPSAAPTESPAPTATPPPASAGPTAAPSTSGETYRVKSGDTLVAIAGRYATTVRVLMELNGIEDPSRLRIGQILKLP
jgi:LysM repeat protein